MGSLFFFPLGRKWGVRPFAGRLLRDAVRTDPGRFVGRAPQGAASFFAAHPIRKSEVRPGGPSERKESDRAVAGRGGGRKTESERFARPFFVFFERRPDAR